MFLVVGLGNPGTRYEGTRHNIGFMALDELARGAGSAWKEQFQGLTATVEAGGERLLLLKPQTFMNRSGHSVRNAMSFFKIPLSSMLVVHDDLDLAFGDIRLKVGGGEAGHNGLRSISEQLASQAYVRLRMGIGRPPPDFRGDGADYVLQAFPLAQAPQVEAAIAFAAQAVKQVATLGVDRAMNEVNRKQKS